MAYKTFKKIVASFLLLIMLIMPMQVFADAPVYTNEEVLARGRLYYSYLEHFFDNIVECSDICFVILVGSLCMLFFISDIS